MELTLGSRVDYAVRAVVDLARHHGGGRRKAREVSEAMAIPPAYLPQVLAPLVRAGIVVSESGPAGGYELRQLPGELTLLQVIVAVEGDPSSTTCVLRGGPCLAGGPCAMHEPWMEAQEAFLARLAAISFADLLADEVATLPAEVGAIAGADGLAPGPLGLKAGAVVTDGARPRPPDTA
jgi:Rrf2 family transcriptional regulator, iron-sulfur cluster assembly transcription factor